MWGYGVITVMLSAYNICQVVECTYTVEWDYIYIMYMGTISRLIYMDTTFSIRFSTYSAIVFRKIDQITNPYIDH